MQAVIKISGRQYRVSPEEVIKVNKLPAEPGDVLTISDVILVTDEGEAQVGTPLLPYRVKLEVLEHGREKKKLTYRFVRRGGMRRKKGYRQHYSRVKIQSIEKAE